ncbi:response regulator [Lachnospiraceae bacterium ASD3451]|uniref:response regulator transcription factor n=1 Tax=Diplocloster agilis TaxID=2850323 RepID=UPI001D1CEFF1|nr:response regulator [Diplocloster agilis]MBU9744891.1 response regulator [Diplocloster agilis]
MDKVVIIDDEIHIRSLVRNLIHWEELGLECAGCYASGQEALERIRETDIDVVITDIQMPGMSGLELIRQIQAVRGECSFIIISGYRDFEYAQTAVKLGVLDYVCKPIDEEELNTSLTRICRREGAVVTKSERKSSPRRKNFVTVIKGQCKEISVDTANKDYDFHFQRDGVFRVLELGFCGVDEYSNVSQNAEKIIKTLGEYLSSRCYEYESFLLTGNFYAMVVQYREAEDGALLRGLSGVYLDLVHRYTDLFAGRFYISAGKTAREIGDLYESYRGADFFIHGRLYYGNSRVYIADYIPELQKKYHESLVLTVDEKKELIRAMEGIQLDGLKKSVIRLYDSYSNEMKENPTLAYYMAFQIFDILISVLADHDINMNELNSAREEFRLKLENCDTLPMLERTLTRGCSDKISGYLSEKKQNAQVYIQFTKEYIEKHYASDLSLNMIAERIQINPSYLSTVFKEQTGINYNKYLTSVRIEKSKELLKDPRYNISQIAQMVGYSSTRYFGKMFVSETGIKPGEYRRLYSGKSGK